MRARAGRDACRSRYERGGAARRRASRSRSRAAWRRRVRQADRGRLGGPRAPPARRDARRSRRRTSPAHAAGLRSGDVVESVNGEPVESWDEFAAAYAAAPRGDGAARAARSERARAAEPGEEPAERRRAPHGRRARARQRRRARRGARDRARRRRVDAGLARPSRAGLRPGDLIVVGRRRAGRQLRLVRGDRAHERRPPARARVRARRRDSHSVVDRAAARGLRRAASASRSRATWSASPPRWRAWPARCEIDRERNPLVVGAARGRR